MFYVLDKLQEITESTTELGIIAKSRKDIIGIRGEEVPVMTRKNIEALTLEFLRRNKLMFPSFYIPSTSGWRSVKK